MPDHLSAWWLRTFTRKARQGDGTFRLWATEEFPYFGWIEQICKLYLPPEALDFYSKTWGHRKQGQQNKQFFTFIKVLINSHDERAAEEMYAAEALSRYIAGMFYALCLAFVSMLITVIVSYIVSHQILTGLIIVLCAYFLVIVVILAHYRLIRIKEEVVFAASLRNKSIFEEAKTTNEQGILINLNWLRQLLLLSSKTK